MNKNLLILGAGQYGTVVKELAEAVGDFEKISFLDDTFGLSTFEGDFHEQSIGKLGQYEELRTEYDYAIVSIKDSEERMAWTKKLLEAGYVVPVLVAPSAYVSPSAQLSKGTVVAPLAVVNANTHIGEGTFVMSGAIVGHNVFVTDYCTIQCGTVVMPGALVTNFKITEPNEVVRKAPMAFSLENHNGEMIVKGKQMELTTNGDLES